MSKALNAYRQTQTVTDVSSSNSMELVCLVYERVLDNLRFGLHEVKEGRYAVQAFTKASDLINFGLLATLDIDQGGEIARNLKSIYEWALQKIIQGRILKSPEIIQEVIDVLIPLYEGWVGITPSKLYSSKHIPRKIQENITNT
jgi:flagellar protein FliS